MTPPVPLLWLGPLANFPCARIEVSVSPPATASTCWSFDRERTWEAEIDWERLTNLVHGYGVRNSVWRMLELARRQSPGEQVVHPAL